MTTHLKRAVVEVRGLRWATSKAVVEHVLLQRPGIASVEANPVAQTATVSFDPSVTSVEQISGWVRDCGYHCRGESVPDHVCFPMEETVRTSAQEMMGHGGHHAGRSMRDMVKDMRNRFLVAAVLSIGVTLWSPWAGICSALPLPHRLGSAMTSWP